MSYRFLTAAAACTSLVGGVLTASPAHADTGPCAVDNGGALPDLIVDATTLANYLSVGDEKLTAKSCSVQEGFVDKPGSHTLLRFTSSTPNVGIGSIVIGDPASCPSLFYYSACHNHYHFRQYADYRLWTVQGWDAWVASRNLRDPTNIGLNASFLASAERNGWLLNGRKMGFCMIDSVHYDTTKGPSRPVFTSCSINQGVSVGWSDRYDAKLDGQWVELGNLKEGTYMLEVHVNAEHLLPESDYTNNSSAVKVQYIPKRSSLPATIEVVP